LPSSHASGTCALGALAEAPGPGVPAVVLPFVNSALASRAPSQHSVSSLRAEGAKILLGPDGVQPHEPHADGALAGSYPWHLAPGGAERLIRTRARSEPGP